MAAAILPAAVVAVPERIDTPSGDADVSLIANDPSPTFDAPPMSPNADPCQGAVVVQTVLRTGGA